MVDLALTPSGDIWIDITPNMQKQRVSAMLSRFGGQRVTCLTSQNWRGLRSAPQKLSFKFSNGLQSMSQDMISEYEDEEFQAILLRLRTELHDVMDDIIGSMFYQTRHTVIKDKDSLSEILRIATEVVNSILPEASVKVEYADGEGFFYCQTVHVTISLEDGFEKTFTF